MFTPIKNGQVRFKQTVKGRIINNKSFYGLE
jgi:hypothetical protein